MPKKLLSILIVAVLISSCSSWNNFRAYYNTFYNTKKSFRAGINQVNEQEFIINPDQPVLVHQSPLKAGSSEFEGAIENGAQILLNYRQSKWVDDALFLIGKSYYYLHKYYSALQKFEELQNSLSAEMQQQAIIWKGKTLLALGDFTDGVTYLEAELNTSATVFNGQKAEIQVLAGEHHAMLGNWDQAAQWLAKAIPNIKNEKLLGRTLFLYGQILERSQRYGEAYYAFSRVKEYFPGFEYVYWAAFKQADVARKQGNMDLAISVYKDLRKDDKNMGRRDELIFQIARTREMEGETGRAVQIYKSLLTGEGIHQDLRAAIYYRLGKINSEIFKDYPVAAAYFDSSSTLNKAEKTTENADAQALARTYGGFASLQKTIQRADSLLWLSTLPPSKLDSVIKQITIKKRLQLLEQREEESENRLLNQNLQAQVNGNRTVSSIYGFLNYRNNELVNRDKAAFRIIWGDRPAVDNWRRIEAVRQTTSGGPMPAAGVNLTASNEETANILDLNIDEIPATPEERAVLQSEKAVAQYELGNLLFLKLNLPDKARFYFHRVINNSVEKELRLKAMYSLYELFNIQNKSDSLMYWRYQILENYPTSKYAHRIALSGNARITALIASIPSADLKYKYQQIVASQNHHNASRLRKLALENRSSDLAAAIYYRAIVEYIKQAKKLTEMNYFVIAAMPPDSLPTLSALHLIQPEQKRQHFTNTYWDSVRMVIKEFNSVFPNAAQNEMVAKLQKVLALSASPKVPTCQSLGTELKVDPGLDHFLSRVKYPQEFEHKSLSGSVTYSFIVTSKGEVESYKLISNRTSLGIEEAFEASFDQLHFQPLTVENPPDRIRCEVKFPIQK